MRVFCTGAAGFIGSHLCDLLLAEGHEVMGYDILVPQVHGGEGLQALKSGDVPPWPAYMDPRVQSWIGDVGNTVELLRALKVFQPDVVVHLAAYVGVGQSWSHPAVYLYGGPVITASLYEAIRAYNAEVSDALGVQRVFVAGSMSAYGEGAFSLDLDAGDDPTPTHELWLQRPANPYAHSKMYAEQTALLLGEQMKIPTVVGRFFNVLGSRQALGNPYTGVVATWSAALLAGQAPVVFEDGEQSRDFIHVSDVASAVLCIVKHGQPSQVYNVGRGERVRILDVAKGLCARSNASTGGEVQPMIPGLVRVGDIRHCFADAGKLRALGWVPKVTLDEALDEQWTWAGGQLEDALSGAVSWGRSVQQATQHHVLQNAASADLNTTGPAQSTPLTLVDDFDDTSDSSDEEAT